LSWGHLSPWKCYEVICVTDGAVARHGIVLAATSAFLPHYSDIDPIISVASAATGPVNPFSGLKEIFMSRPFKHFEESSGIKITVNGLLVRYAEEAADNTTTLHFNDHDSVSVQSSIGSVNEWLLGLD
jgi:hypothetical protein